MSRDAPGRRLDVGPADPDAETLDAVCAHLRDGGLIAYPTETVYGFGCALRKDALERLRRLKDRADDRPFLLLVPEEDSIAELRWTAAARELAGAFWPGALTLVLEDPGARYPAAVRSPAGGVAVRRTPHPVAGALVERLGEPLTSTSANRPAGQPAATAEGAADEARAVGAGREMWLLDGGALPPSQPSTIVDCTGREPTVVRKGAVSLERLRHVVPGIR